MKQDLINLLLLLLSYFRTSLQYGISCLKRLNYDRDALEERRKNSENEIKGKQKYLYFICYLFVYFLLLHLYIN